MKPILCRYCGIDLLTIDYSCCELRSGDVDAITGKVNP